MLPVLSILRRTLCGAEVGYTCCPGSVGGCTWRVCHFSTIVRLLISASGNAKWQQHAFTGASTIDADISARGITPAVPRRGHSNEAATCTRSCAVRDVESRSVTGSLSCVCCSARRTRGLGPALQQYSASSAARHACGRCPTIGDKLIGPRIITPSSPCNVHSGCDGQRGNALQSVQISPNRKASYTPAARSAPAWQPAPPSSGGTTLKARGASSCSWKPTASTPGLPRPLATCRV